MKYGHYQMIVTGVVVNSGEDDESIVLDRTWNDIYNAFNGGFVVVLYMPTGDGYSVLHLLTAYKDEADYFVEFTEGVSTSTDNPDSFPVVEK